MLYVQDGLEKLIQNVYFIKKKLQMMTNVSYFIHTFDCNEPTNDDSFNISLPAKTASILKTKRKIEICFSVKCHAFIRNGSVF